MSAKAKLQIAALVQLVLSAAACQAGLIRIAALLLIAGVIAAVCAVETEWD